MPSPIEEAEKILKEGKALMEELANTEEPTLAFEKTVVDGVEHAYYETAGVEEGTPIKPPVPIPNAAHRPIDEPMDKDKIEHFISSIMESLNDMFHMDLQELSLSLDKKRNMLALRVGTTEKEITAFLEPKEGVWVLKDIETTIPDKEVEMTQERRQDKEGKPDSGIGNWKPCSSCGGTGEALSGGTCSRCDGEGYIETA